MISTNNNNMTSEQRIERAFAGLGFADDALLAHLKGRLLFEMEAAKAQEFARLQELHDKELAAVRERSIKPGPKFRTVVNGDYVYVYADRPGGSELAGVAHKGDHYWHAYGYKRNASHNAVILGTWPQRTVAASAIQHFAEYEGYLKE